MRKFYSSWSKGDKEGVSHCTSAQRVYFNVENGHCEENKIQKDAVTGLQNGITDVAQVSQRAASTTSRFENF